MRGKEIQRALRLWKWMVGKKGKFVIKGGKLLKARKEEIREINIFSSLESKTKLPKCPKHQKYPKVRKHPKHQNLQRHQSPQKLGILRMNKTAQENL